jgi:hypothetical protein
VKKQNKRERAQGRAAATRRAPRARVPLDGRADAQAPGPARSTPICVGTAALARALARGRGYRGSAAQVDIFKPYQPPEFIAKQMKAAGLPVAMDSALSVPAGWAAGALSSAIAEGLTFLGYPDLAAMAQRPEYRVITEVIAEEMTRKWIRLHAEGDDKDDKAEKIKQLKDEMDRLDVQGAFRKIAEQDGYFGRAHLYLDTGDGSLPDELRLSIGDGTHGDPLSKRKFRKGKLVALRTVEAVWTYPVNYNSIDPLAASWYNPQTWFVMGKEVHVTRLLKFVGREVPDLLKPAYAFGGLSLSQMAKPYVDNWLRTRQAVADIVVSFTTFVLKGNLQSANLATDGQAFYDRLDLFNLLRSNQGVMAVDKDSEDLVNVSAPLGTLDVLQAQTQEHMAAVSRVPLVKLLGITPNGLNASSEGEIRTFYDTIHAQQKRLFDKHLKTVICFIQRSLWGDVDPSITYEWEPLWALDEKGQAEVDKIKADTGAVLIDSGAIDQQEERERVARDPASPYPGLDLNKEIEPPEPEMDPDNPFAPKEDGEQGEKKPVPSENGEKGNGEKNKSFEPEKEDEAA